MKICFRNRIDGFPLYISYLYLIGLYIVFLRLNSIPNVITGVLYGLSIFLAIIFLTKKGLSSFKYKTDSFLLTFFLVYYFISSIIFVTTSNIPESSWIIKDWLYSLLPILFYIIIRQSKFKCNIQIVLKISIYSIAFYDVLAMVFLFFPGSPIESLFSREMIENETVAYALFGILGAILGGFTNVIALAICLLSPISIRGIYKVILSIFFIVCTFMVGQRTPIGGVLIIILISFFFQKGKSRWIILFTLLFLAIIYSNISIDVGGFDVKDAMTERYFDRFDVITSGSETRGGQKQFLNTDSLLGIVFGNGVGAYSPENPYTTISMPDAMLFRIFNEMGIIGLISFLLFFFINIKRAFLQKNSFMIALLLYIFMANYFNRVLFTAPLSIIPYVLISIFNWQDSAVLYYKKNNVN